MANAAKLMLAPRARMLLTGYPGAGKTGSIASLANAGFKIRMLDFDGNPESLLRFTDPAKLPNIDILSFEDALSKMGQYVGTKGTPTAFMKSLDALDAWKYKDGETEVDLGASKTWGTDTVVVLDGITGLGKAAFRHAQAMMNKTPLNTTQAVWGLAIQNQEAYIERLTSDHNPHHVIVISHLKIVGPKAIVQNDDSVNQQIKQEQADLVPTRLYPSALGWALPQNIAQHFPVVVNLESKAKGTAVKRRFSVYPRQDMDLKLPVKNLEALADLGPEDGLLRIFEAMSCYAPGHQK